ncbi:hypothetical protein [Acinetobacter sp. MD2(2019)]|uniref:hypothetical protein n=1 Tax=Acinetobacter sp. MD2(2019) TaxID=2605273 RepID=UPI002D1E6BF7|nr:hypothetical protein [Acinetobacter sp. MD2(2019)]MEB3754406.1 hypothetical protein [Acinetobacter sp. MD2(2019)]
MSTLSIQDIFSNLEGYQSRFVAILEHPAQYYQVVEGAKIQFDAMSEQKIYLGDLLQLWFAKSAWIENDAQAASANKLQLVQQTQRSSQDHRLYFFAFLSDRLKPHSMALAWSEREQAVVTVNLQQTWLYYLSFIALTRPKHS